VGKAAEEKAAAEKAAAVEATTKKAAIEVKPADFTTKLNFVQITSLINTGRGYGKRCQ
jgi:hypothetical protein